MMKRITAGFFVALMIVGVGLIANMLPLRAQYAGQATFGGTSTCSSNAQTINLGAGNLVSITDLIGVTISWKEGSGCTNDGPSTLAFTGFSGGPYNIYRRNGGALIALGGGEMPAGDLIRATYDGTQFELETDYTGGAPVGSELSIEYITPDPGYALENGQCLSESGEPALYAKLGTASIGGISCSAGQYAVPDKRGRVDAGADNIGGTAANRLNAFAATAIGDTGGTQGYMSGIAPGYLTALTVSGTLTGSTANGYSNTGSSGSGEYYILQNGFGAGGQDLSVTVSGTLSCSDCSSTAFPTFPNSWVVYKEIKL